MLWHHAEVFKQLQKQFPDAEVYVGTSDKVEPPKSPFNFKEKQLIASAHGVPAERVLQATRPYHKDDYARYFDENNTVIIFAVGEKDLDRFPFTNVDPKTGLDMTVRGESRPKYYQKINTLNNDVQPMSTRGYITLAPTIKLGDEVASASAFRDALQNAPDKEAAKELFTKQFGNYNEKVFNLIYNKITGANMNEHINLLKKLAGLPVAEAAPVQFGSDANAKTAKFLPPNAASAKFSIANRFPKGADVNDPAVKQEQFIQALLKSPESLISEMNERLDPKDDNSLAVGQKLSDIVQLMNQKDMGIAGLPKDMKQFVLDLTVNAVKNMQLVAGDDSPAYNDAAEKESVDLSNIRNDYGVDEAVRDDNKESLFLNAVQDIIAQAEEVGAYGDVNDESIKRAYSYFQKGDAAGAAEEILSSFSNQDGGEVAALQGVYDDAVAELKAMMNSSVGEDKEEDDDDSWIPSEDEFDQEVKHGYKGRTTEAINPADYTATQEESQFGGYRPKVVNNKNNSMMYLGQLSFADPEDAVRAAEVYINTYAERGDEAASDAIMDFGRMLKHRLVKKADKSVEEGFSSESDQVLAKAGSGELDIYDVMTNPKNPAEVTAAKIIQQMYDDVAIDHGLHPDDDFEPILDIVADQLADEYGDSDADVREDGQLDELTNKTLRSYRSKRSAQRADAKDELEYHKRQTRMNPSDDIEDRESAYAYHNALRKDINKMSTGINRASAKIRKEELDEISDETKASYMKKAGAEIDKHWDNSKKDARSAYKYYGRKNTMKKIANEEAEGTANNAISSAMAELRKLAGL